MLWQGRGRELQFSRYSNDKGCFPQPLICEFMSRLFFKMDGKARGSFGLGSGTGDVPTLARFEPTHRKDKHLCHPTGLRQMWLKARLRGEQMASVIIRLVLGARH